MPKDFPMHTKKIFIIEDDNMTIEILKFIFLKKDMNFLFQKMVWMLLKEFLKKTRI